jgi:U3 small nucleolar RNA-associated protein 12
LLGPDISYFLQVFFLDTLKFCLSLYGHKLPVLCMDISSDGAFIVTGSADKNLTIWGMDFGVCHKSIFAHTDRSFSAFWYYLMFLLVAEILTSFVSIFFA